MTFLNQHLFPRIFDALASREGQEVTLPTLETLTGLSAKQIQGAIANARKVNDDHRRRIEVVKPGRTWKFHAIPDANGVDTIENIVKAVDMGSPHIWKHVAAVLVAHPGEILSKEQIAEKINAAGELTMRPDQVSSTMNTIIRKPEFVTSVEVVWNGRSWRYIGNKRSAGVKSAKPSEHEQVSPSIRASVLRYFTLRPGEILFADEIASDLGFTRKQVQSAVYSMVTESTSAVRDEFTIVQSGQSWRYMPKLAALNGRVTEPLEKVPALAVKPSPAVTFTHAGPRAVPAATPAPLPAPSRVTTPITPEPAPEVKPTSSPAPAVGGRLFEEIGQTTDGALLLQEGESRKIYRATEL